MTRSTTQRRNGRSESRSSEPRGRTPRGAKPDESEAEDTVDAPDGEEAATQDGGSSGGVFAELKNVASDAALSVLAPVAKQAATTAAKYAVKKAPELLEDTVKPMLEEAGGVKGLAGQMMSSDGPAGGMLGKLIPGDDDDEDGGGNAGDGTGRGRRMPIQQSVDVAAPIDIVYDQWTQFEDYPKFMHRVQRVEQRDESHVAFHAKVWGLNRMWEAEIVEQRPDERIVFKSVNGVQLTGVVTFHDLAERLTRIELNIDVDPEGPVEKIARGTRVIKRAARGDLKRFKAYVEMHEDETGAWRGEIQDGDVVSEPGDEDRAEDEGYEDEEPEAEAYDEQDEQEEQDEDTEDEQPDEPEASEEEDLEDEQPDEPEASEEDEEEEPAEEEEEKQQKPKRKRSPARASGGGSAQSKRRGQTKAKSQSSSSSSRSRGSSSKSTTKKASGRKTASRSRS
jgi:uncharacterized membrane protein